MKKYLLLASSLLLCSCYPTERVFWSPKGDRALVMLDKKLHLVTAAGQFSPEPLLDIELDEMVFPGVSWLPDGGGVLLSAHQRFKHWDEVKSLISTEEREGIERLLPGALKMLEASVALSPEADSIHQLIGTAMPQDRSDLKLALLVSYERDPENVHQILQSLKHGTKIIETLRSFANDYEVNQLHVVRFDPTPQDTVLMSSLIKSYAIPKASPQHSAFACYELNKAEENITLFVGNLEGKQRIDIAKDLHALSFDWLPDGRQLVYASSEGSNKISIHLIHTSTVLQGNGEPMKQSTELQPDGHLVTIKGADRLQAPKLLGTAILSDVPRLTALPDGKILFATPAISLPLIASEEELTWQFSVIESDQKSISSIPTKPGDLPAGLGFFAVSPDGKWIAVVENATDAVAVVDVASGTTQIISPPHPNWHCETMPSWKSATELSFAALDEASKQPQLVLWSTDGTTKTWSEGWPVSTKSGWLSERKPEKGETTE